MMEGVAVMVASVISNDELSETEESINLELRISDNEHLSDNEDSTERLKQCDAETIEQTETEEDILNKFIDDTAIANAKKLEESKAEKPAPALPNGSLVKKIETYEKCNGHISPLSDEQDDNLDETLVNVGDDEDIDEEINVTAEDVQASKNESQIEKEGEDKDKCEKVSNVEDCEKSVGDEKDKTNSDQTDSDKKTDSVAEMETEDSNTSYKETKTKNDENDISPKPTDETATKPTNDTKADDSEDNDDLLCVMEEKSVEEANDNKDENSCSASEKDDEPKENEESNNDEAKEDEEMEEHSESQTDLDIDASECAMDIEESDIGGVVYTDQDRDLRTNQTENGDDKIETDKDANKENEHGDSVVTSSSASVQDEVISNNALTNGIAEEGSKDDDSLLGAEEEGTETQKKSTKRQLSDSSEAGESAKKIKLQTEEVEKPPEKRAIILLDSFKKFMLDKKLKNLTRFELEELCMQKMCECIVNKSEIGELRQKIMIQEQTIDTWRKEAIVVAKQTRDLKIVHERLMADLKVMKEQTGKPLVPVKITRSVGLQAIIENPSRVRTPIINGTNTPPQRTPIVNNNTKNVSSPQNRQPIKPKVQPQRVTTNNSRPLQPITQKDNVNNAKPRQITASPQQNKKNADPKAVIDLTDEDEKNQNAKQATNTATPTVRILNKQNVSPKPAVSTPSTQPSKIMFVTPNVLPRNSAVMVKMNSNGLVSPQNGITTIANGQVSVVTTPVVRTVSQVRVPVSSVSTVRSPATPKPPFKHPAPLPAAPNYQGSALAGKKPIPPKPHLNLTRSSCGTGIVLQWKMPYKLDSYETIVSYQLYAYQETKSPPKTDNWGKIGDVKALELPMAVTLTQFAVGNRYFFAVRAVDGQKRLGPFSEPENILL